MAKKSTKATKPKPLDHVLVPKHELLSKKDLEKLLEKYNITLLQLPKISKGDPAMHILVQNLEKLLRLLDKVLQQANQHFIGW